MRRCDNCQAAIQYQDSGGHAEDFDQDDADAYSSDSVIEWVVQLGRDAESCCVSPES